LLLFGGTEVFSLTQEVGVRGTSEIPNESTVSGTSVSDALDALKTTSDAALTAFSGIRIPIIPLLSTSGWVGGITDDYMGTGVGGAMGIALPLYPGLRLTTVYVSIEPATGHGGVLPSGMPFVQCYITSPSAHTSAGNIGTVVDASPNATVYEGQHTLTLTLSSPRTVNDQNAWLRINDETGVPGLRIKWIAAVYVP